MLVLEWLPHKECEPEIWIRMSGSRSQVTAIPGNADRIHCPESINITVHNIEHMFKSMNSLVAPPFETLVWLGRNPRQSYYVRELAKVLSISTGAASGQLRMLDEQGLITSEQKGRTLMYRANISHPVVREVKILATLLELSPLIASLANSAERMILFGSCASRRRHRGERHRSP